MKKKSSSVKRKNLKNSIFSPQIKDKRIKKIYQRFEFLIKLLPLQFNKISPEDKLVVNNNPPKMIIDFFMEQKNLKKINCFSDEGGSWDNSNINLKENQLIIYFREKFKKFFSSFMT